MQKRILLTLVVVHFLIAASAQLYVNEQGNVYINEEEIEAVGVEESPEARMYINNMLEATTLHLVTNVTATEDVHGIYNDVIASGTSPTYGIYSNVAGQSGGSKIGIYSRVPLGDGVAGFFEGDIFVTGRILEAGGGINPSSKTAPINNALNLVQGLQPKQTLENSNKNYGFITEEVASILPSLVKTNNLPDLSTKNSLQAKNSSAYNNTNTDRKSINYDELVPILTQAIKEQQELIEQLTQRIKKLEEK